MNKDCQAWESDWWGTCQNTYGEEMKQILYASKMGLSFFHNGKSPYNINLKGGSVLDIGGGPVSLLLKCVNGKGTVVDPCNYPFWVADRYREAGISYFQAPGESIDLKGFDEVWIYNCLQHTEDPKKIIKNALLAGKIVRIFEWIECGTSKGHPHELTEKGLNAWLRGEGKVETLNGQATCFGKCYYGIFKGVPS